MRCAILLFIVATASADDLFLPNRIDKASMKMLKEAYLASEDSNVVTSPLGVLLLLSLYSSGVNDETRNEIMTLLSTKNYEEIQQVHLASPRDSNTVTSPLGALLLLSLFSSGINDETGKEIMTLLGSSSYKEITKSYTSLGAKFASMDSGNFTLANKIYVANNFMLDDEFSNTMRAYKSEIDSIDFNNTSVAADIINQWAAKKTKGHIKNPVSEKSLDRDATAALFNVIFFQGHWHVPFKAKETKDKDFYVNKSVTIKKPMMHLLKPLFYYENKELGARLIELPYQEPDFRMVVVLPDEVDGLASVLDKVNERGLLENVFALSPAYSDINLYIPKFDITSKLDYKSILPKLGVKRIFDEGAPGIVKEGNVTVSKLFQEANVKVDEEGATAGAFTGVVLVPASYPAAPPEPLDFIVDHPFLFAILHKDVILFTGTYSQ